MKLFAESQRPYVVIVKTKTVGNYSLIPALTQQEALTVALEQLKIGGQVHGIAKMLDASVALSEPLAADEKVYLVVEEHGTVVDYVAWDNDKQQEIMQMILTRLSNPNHQIQVINGRDLRGKV